MDRICKIQGWNIALGQVWKLTRFKKMIKKRRMINVSAWDMNSVSRAETITKWPSEKKNFRGKKVIFRVKLHFNPPIILPPVKWGDQSSNFLGPSQSRTEIPIITLYIYTYCLIVFWIIMNSVLLVMSHFQFSPMTSTLNNWVI